MSTLIQKHRGRVVDSPGDNLLAEFSSVVDAVRCAVEIQEELRVRNTELPDSRKMHFRIGINLGDVVEEGDRIYGDGINIAARVENLAEGGGICISGSVYDSIKNKLSLSYESLGEHTVKNINEPVRVFRMRVGPEAAAPVVKEKKARMKKRQWAALAAVIIFIVGALVVWNFYFRPPRIEPASVEKMAFPLPEKPSIAVLPFVNLSGDPKDEFFSDALTEEIITALSKIPGMFVIARNSTFTYKGKPVKVQRVAEELGVQYVLEGSVQKGGDKIRIKAQLIDALTGRHLWAERYDRDLRMKDIFEIQDGITVQVLEALRIKITKAEVTPVRRSSTDNLEAYLKAIKALDLQYRSETETGTLEELMMARKLLEEAIALDPDYSGAYVILAHNFWAEAERGGKTPEISYERGIEMAKKAISLDETNIRAYNALAQCYHGLGQAEKAAATVKKAMALNPNNSQEYAIYAYMVLRYEERFEEAIRYIEEAKRLNPVTPWYYYLWAGALYANVRNYEKATQEWKQYIKLQNLKGRPVAWIVHLWLLQLSLELHREEEASAAATELFKDRSRVPMKSTINVHTVLTQSFLRLGREEEAYAAATELLKINPEFPLESALNIQELQKNDAKDRLLASLQKAGLLQKEEVSVDTPGKWQSDADGYGRDGIFTRKNPPAFSFEYPADFQIQPLQQNDIFRFAAPRGLPLVNVEVGRISGKFIEFMQGYGKAYKEALAGFGDNVNVIYNQPLAPETYGEDYPSQELAISWRYGGGALFKSYVNVIVKGEYYISMQAHMDGATVGTEADMDMIKDIFETIDLEP
jgi:TolB-like protein/Tfp pilus assembly protein PilF